MTYRQISLKLVYAYKLSYKKYKSVKHRVIGSLFRRQQLIKDRGKQICTPHIGIGLHEFDNSYAHYSVSSFFCNYYCSKWYQKHRIHNWLVEWNKFGTANFWVRYFFRASILFLVFFSETFWKELVCLFCKSLLPFLTLPCGWIFSQPLTMFRYCIFAITSHHKNKQKDSWNSSRIRRK